MKNKIRYILLFILALFFVKTNVLAEEINIFYSTHIQDIGWMNYVKNDELAGTTGRSKRLEGIRIKLDNCSDCIEYKVHVQDIGWMNYVKNDELAGTTGRSKRLEAIQIRLKGELADKYDIYYRVHVQDIGWMNYVKNDELAGTTGRSKRLEAIQIKLVKKEGYVEPEDINMEENLDDVERELSLTYKSSAKGGTWYAPVNNDEISGLTGNSTILEYLNISLKNTTTTSGSIMYQVYNSLSGWQEYKNSENDAGRSGEQIEAVRIKLTGNLANKYDIYYHTHVSNIGWMAWTKNNSISGTIGYFNPIEAIQIALIEKGTTGKDTSGNSYLESKNEITYSAHVSDIGWMSYVSNNSVAGTTGQSKKMEAIKVKLNTKSNSSIEYQSYVENKGWQNYVQNNSESGTTGLSRKIEAIKIRLTGKLSEYYDIYYRTHVSDIGWLDWAKNDEKSGSVGNGTQIEAIQIRLVKKNEVFNESTSTPYVTGTFSNNRYVNYFGKTVAGFQWIDGIKYYFDGDGNLVVRDAKKVIDVSSWQGDINWDIVKNYTDVDEVIIRVGWGTSFGDECGVDSKLDRNMREVQRLGIPYGVYIYAYAETTSAAEKEADFVISKLEKYNAPKSTYVWYDAEIQSLSRDTYNTVIPAFINRMKSRGYNNVGVYGGVRQLDTYPGNLNTSTIRNYPIWVSQYYKKLQYEGEFLGWQYASDEKISGIEGDVDVSVFKK